MAGHLKACPLVWWLVGAPYRTDKDVSEEGSGKVED